MIHRLLRYLYNRHPAARDLAAARATITGLSARLSRQADNTDALLLKVAQLELAKESLRLQLQACRRHGDALAERLGEEAQRVIELEAEASGWITRQAMRLPISEN